MLVRCPRCKKEVLYEGNVFRPFCSERCRLIDLGDWASGKHAIASESSKDDPKKKSDDPDDSDSDPGDPQI
jgi:endogenous inhibitor of DNA gyrase (YacG/DUF329 family)